MGKDTKRRTKGAAYAQRDVASTKKSENLEEQNVMTNGGTADINMLQERLARLEHLQLSQNSDSSNLLKFAFFFLMGMLLTTVLYPKIATTLEEASSVDKLEMLSKSEANVVINDVNDDQQELLNEIENNIFDDNTELSKPSKRESESRIKNNRQGRNTENMDQEPKDTSDENGNDLNDRSLEAKHKETLKSVKDHVIKLSGGDLMEVEIEGIEASAKAKSSDKPETVLKKIPEEQVFEDDTGKEVKLVRAPVDDEVAEVSSAKKGKQKKKSKTTSKTDAKKAPKGNQANSESSGNNNNLPPEIKNFKPTYLKEVKPKKVFVDGRRIPPMELLPQKPNNSSVKVWLFEEFLSDAECDGLRRVHNKHVQEQSVDDPILCFDSVTTLRKHLRSIGKRVKVTPKDFTEGTTCVNATFSSQLKQWLRGNWSYSTAFYPGESPFATAFENRVKQAMGLLPENGGKFQITSYPLGIGYKAHTDCRESSDKRDRVATILVYLDTVEEGGETEFTELGIWARPRKGRALMWNNMNPDGECEPLSIHRANKVLKGHKFILQRWYYYQSFYSLGKRPPEPPLPKRKPGQPRVSCDEYEHGSCRWYDEWNFEHMIEYERQKYSLV